MEQKTSIAPTTALVDCARIFAAIELSKKTWLLAIYRPSLDRTSQYRVKPGDAAHLLELLGRARQQEERELGQTIGISCCYEASYDGFWLHRQLEAAGVENFVIDPTSLLVNRRARRAKTDRIDVRGLLRSLIAWLRGDKDVCRMVHPPSPAEEDARRTHRERQRLIKERVGHVNRIKGLLATQGIYDHQPIHKDRRQAFAELRTADGEPLPSRLRQELERELTRLELVLDQIRQVEAERDAVLDAAKHNETSVMAQLIKLKSIGPEAATILGLEMFYRDFTNRRQVAAYAGLTPSPFDSGFKNRDQGISKAGNALVRKTLIEIAWIWLRWQPDSALSQWFKQRTTHQKSRGLRINIVALARKLLIALWRFVTTGVVPEGAVLKAA
jgi:transposase